MPAAAAVELIHNFSLIHDDIEDVSYERHHRPTVWKLWGQSQAINAGDVMFTLAYLALLKLQEKGIADEKVASSIKMLSLACLELCEGQYLDVEYENRGSQENSSPACRIDFFGSIPGQRR
jgi:geranylgeranyl diphosphate synthase type I